RSALWNRSYPCPLRPLTFHSCLENRVMAGFPIARRISCLAADGTGPFSFRPHPLPTARIGPQRTARGGPAMVGSSALRGPCLRLATPGDSPPPGDPQEQGRGESELLGSPSPKIGGKSQRLLQRKGRFQGAALGAGIERDGSEASVLKR